MLKVSGSGSGGDIQFTCDSCGSVVQVRTLVHDPFFPYLKCTCEKCGETGTFKIVNSYGIEGAERN